VEPLKCAQDWLRASTSCIDVEQLMDDVEQLMDDIEKYEAGK